MEIVYLTSKESCAKPPRKKKQLLMTYKKSKKYLKGMKLRYHGSLWNHDNKLKDVCSKILHKASTGICDEIIKALEKEIWTLKTKHNNSNNIKNKTTRENYKLIKKVVAEKVFILEQVTTKERSFICTNSNRH